MVRAAFSIPAYFGLLPRTVPDEELQEAQALSSFSLNFAELTGPAIATALVLGLGAGWAFLLDAATFVVSVMLLARVRTPDVVPAPSERRTLLAELGEGFHEVRSRAWMWVTVAVFALAVPLGYAPLFVLGPTVAEETYDSAAVFGVVTASYGAGALVGAIAGFRWRPERPMLAAFCVLAVWPVMIVAFALGAPVALVVPLAVATGMGFALFDVFWDTTMAEQIPPARLSRASAWEWMGSLILLPVGYLAAGPVADATSTETVLAGGAILTASVLSLGLLPRATRTLRSAGAWFRRVADSEPGNTPNVMMRETWLPAAPEGVPRARAIVRELAGDLSLDPTTTWDLVLATSEAFANAVEHGRPCDPRGIFLRAEMRDGRVGVEVADCGGCFSPELTTTKAHGEGGRGMRIIEALMDQFEVQPARGATRVRFATRTLTRVS